MFKEIDKSNDNQVQFVELAKFIKSLGIKSDQLNGNFETAESIQFWDKAIELIVK